MIKHKCPGYTTNPSHCETDFIGSSLVEDLCLSLNLDAVHDCVKC